MTVRRVSIIMICFALFLSACTIRATPAATPTITLSPVPSLTFAPTFTPLPPTATPTPTPPSVETLPDPSSYSWVLVVSGLDHPVNLANAADGSGRIFVLEKKGLIRVVKDGALQTAPFLDIRSRVGSAGDEQGLLGLAFHPDFNQNHTFFVDYTDRQGNTVIARFNASADGVSADPASERILLQVRQPYANHNGGQLVFGPDGMLWIGMGDGGSQGDPHGNGQSLQTLLGKILRIDVDHGSPYAIPADNPFATGGGLPEIWAYGLRNPWKFSFDPGTSDLYIGDVGQDKWEEIDYIPAGFSSVPANFGWNLMEGDHPYKGNGSLPANYVAPVMEYNHSLGCAVIGGQVYRGSALPSFNGVYLYGDYCSGTVWGMVRDGSGKWQNAALFQTGVNISAFGSDEQGELYLLDLKGSLYKLVKK